MSRRRDRAGRVSEERQETSKKGGLRLPVQVGLLVAAFAVAVGVAELAGAANLGVAFGVGQVVFALVLIGLLSRA